MEAAGTAEEGHEALMHIDEADLVTPLVIYEKPLPLFGGNAYARIQYINLEILLHGD
jgi:hypothetical protein